MIISIEKCKLKVLAVMIFECTCHKICIAYTIQMKNWGIDTFSIIRAEWATIELFTLFGEMGGHEYNSHHTRNLKDINKVCRNLMATCLDAF